MPLSRLACRFGILLATAAMLLAAASQAEAQPTPPVPPAPPTLASGPFTLTIGGLNPSKPEQVSVGIQLLILLTVLSLVPALLMMLTSFVRIVVVLGFIRRAIGTAEVPPNQVLLGLALFLTFFVMAPTLIQVNDKALQPYLAGKITPQEAYNTGITPIREFLFAHCRKSDLALFVRLARLERPQSKDDIPSHVLIPAFMISELKTAFIIGFVIYVPFLVIDMVVASILLSMGMWMFPPTVVALPFKVLLFVLVDGWNLVIGSLMRGLPRMTEYLVIDIMQQSFKLALILALPSMAAALIVGMIVAVFQAVTSIQEQTLVFVPKMLAVMLTLILFFSTMMAMAIQFTASLYGTIPDLAR